MPKKESYEIANTGNKKLIEEFLLLITQIQYKLNNKELSKSDTNKYRFKLRHFKNTIRIISQFPDKIKKGEDLKHISGIGKGISCIFVISNYINININSSLILCK